MKTHVGTFSWLPSLAPVVLSVLLHFTATPCLQAQYTTNAVTIAGGNGQGSAANQLNAPRGMVLDDQGNLYVGDGLNSRVQKFVPGSTEGITVAGGTSGTAADQLAYVAQIAFDSKGILFVVDQGIYSRIQKFTLGNTQGVTVSSGPFNQPFGIAFDSQDNMYIVDQNYHRVLKFTPGSSEGVVVAGGRGMGAGADQLEYPLAVVIDKQGSLYVSDRGNNRIQKFTGGSRDGITIIGSSGEGSTASQLKNPAGLFLDKQENLYVADAGNHRIQKFAPGSSQATTVAGGAGSGSKANQFNAPSGLVIDSEGNLLVVDTGNSRIQKFTKNTTLPVTLVNFNARKDEGNKVSLEWTTAEETNSQSFEVEHSVNGKNWDVIASLAARQESKQLSRYSYIHDTPSSGANLYRLKMIDKDQSFAYSRIANLDFEEAFQLVIYPNPAINSITIKGSITQQRIREVKIFDIQGRAVYSSGKMVQSQIDISKYSAGRYLLLVSDAGGKTQNLRFIKE